MKRRQSRMLAIHVLIQQPDRRQICAVSTIATPHINNDKPSQLFFSLATHSSTNFSNHGGSPTEPERACDQQLLKQECSLIENRSKSTSQQAVSRIPGLLPTSLPYRPTSRRQVSLACNREATFLPHTGTYLVPPHLVTA